jgi:hypothetical protein
MKRTRGCALDLLIVDLSIGLPGWDVGGNGQQTRIGWRGQWIPGVVARVVTPAGAAN